MAVGVAQERPPFVVFERVAVEDRAASVEAGHYVAQDIDMAFITPVGSKDRIERRVVDWFENLEREVANGRFPRMWLSEFKAAYAAWKEGKEIPVNGTPIVAWPVASPAQIKMLVENNIRTVEDLAAANEEAISRLGMGGRALKDRAGIWLQSSADQGKLTEELNALRIEKKDFVERQKKLEETVAKLTKELEKLSKEKSK